jgi:hypothetical protein
VSGVDAQDGLVAILTRRIFRVLKKSAKKEGVDMEGHSRSGLFEHAVTTTESQDRTKLLSFH